MKDSIAAWDSRTIERDYWTDVYIYLNRYLSDPLYHAENFWHLGCDFIESIYLSLQRVEKDRLQAQSVSTAYLTDTLLSIVHRLYGKDGDKYKSQPQAFLPGYEPEKSEDDEKFELDDRTIEIFMSEYQKNRIPQFALLHLMQFIPEWSQNFERK